MTMTTGEPPHYGPRGHSVPAPTATTIPTGVCGTSMPPLTISIVNMWLEWWPILTWQLTLTSSGTCFTPSQVGSNKPHNSLLNQSLFLHRFWTELYAPTSDGTEKLLSRRKILGKKKKDEEPAERRKAEKTKKKGKKTKRIKTSENYARIR